MAEVLKSCPFEEPIGKYEIEKAEKPMTEQEYLQTCDTEQLAEWIADKSNEIISWIICEVIENECDVDENDYWQKKSDVLEWLKQPHTVKE